MGENTQNTDFNAKLFFIKRKIRSAKLVAFEKDQFVKVSVAAACQHLDLMNNQNFCVLNAAIVLVTSFWDFNLEKLN